MTSREDVARLAEVSPSVVSYVLNKGPRPVAPATRERVLAAVRELGYRPKSAARALRLSHTMTLGLVIPDLANPYFVELATALEDQARAAGYALLVANSAGSADREAGYVQTFLDRQVDGLLLTPAHRGQPWHARLARTGVPCVAVDREVRAASISHVLVDNVRGAHQATEHLLRHGRRRIGCIAGQLGLRPTTDRVTGWRTALEAAGLRAGSGSGGRTGWQARPAAAPLLHGSYGRLEGYRAALALLAHDRSVDALFVTSDEQAAGVLRAAHELGIRIPDDLAVVSFDGTTAGAYSTPALSTMRQPVEQLARTAMMRLTGLMRDPDLPPGRDVLPAELLARGSCGCPAPESAPPSHPGKHAAVEDHQMA
ncbi:LacI family DNA-binding transcriptional regulator [Streptomyces sp. 900105755]